MDLADDISYSVHDVEDAVVGGRLDLDVLNHDEERARVVAAVHGWYGYQVGGDDLLDAMDRLVAARLWAPRFDGSRGGARGAQGRHEPAHRPVRRRRPARRRGSGTATGR